MMKLACHQYLELFVDFMPASSTSTSSAASTPTHETIPRNELGGLINAHLGGMNELDNMLQSVAGLLLWRFRYNSASVARIRDRRNSE